jgi:hypothetical protein
MRKIKLTRANKIILLKALGRLLLSAESHEHRLA